MDQKIIEKAEEIISNKNLDCVLALIDLDGFPTASSITVLKNDGLKWLTFSSFYGNNKTNRIEKCNRASVCFISNNPILYNITLVGKIEVVMDLQTKKEMWIDDLLKTHFNGYDDPKYCVLKFTTERYNLMIGDEVTGINERME
jgi:general stress protein 26